MARVRRFGADAELSPVVSRSSRNSGLPEAAPTERLDKWLWAARFFKTRQLAVEAINGGKVHVNGQRAKPGKEISTGARLQITKEPHFWDITVTGINLQRRPAKEAVMLFEETAESHAKRQAEIAKRREERELQASPDRRPNKKERRAIHRFIRDVSRD